MIPVPSWISPSPSLHPTPPVWSHFKPPPSHPNHPRIANEEVRLMLLKFPPFPRFRLTGLRAWRPTNAAYPWPSCGPARRELGREAARGHPAK